ncbi:hypothetical protein GWI33_005620 [Rhynchophorus ferrugineus]|uniref:proline--tRNA ligase n=1 Tax=Rhynchophorus ferrugineus TaxID=354439 RepID=A0A834ILD7_RHYFE|nr:hypothetical protein GWI33_005620 [Rhynchophorus ferrugineus]
MAIMHRMSRLFQPFTVISKTSNLSHKDITSKSQRLMLELGVIHQANPGCFHYLPLGVRALNKLINIVDNEMQNIGGQKLIFPTLVKSDLWTQSGRADAMGPELITIQDRHDHKYILAPTHEETASHLLSTIPPLSYKNFPLLLYQITPKFRDEMKPRFGLIRSREFIMKDMYSYDTSIDNAKKTYEIICKSYDKLFRKIGVKYVKVLGHSGTMGGNLSHEYHFLTDKGEDKILTCNNCSYTANQEFYSRNWDRDQNMKRHILQMGSYGIGISRIIAASLECLSTEQELRWPDVLAPYNVIIIPPKHGSKEYSFADTLTQQLYINLETSLPFLKDNVLVDDRTSLTIGRRFLDARRTGYRFIIILNKKCMESPPLYELNDLVRNQQLLLNGYSVVKYISDYLHLE